MDAPWQIFESRAPGTVGPLVSGEACDLSLSKSGAKFSAKINVQAAQRICSPKVTKAQPMVTNPRDAFRGQSRSPNMILFDMLGMVSYYCSIVTLSVFEIGDLSFFDLS